MLCEGIGKGGLADACFAAYEDHLARSAHRPFKTLIQALQLVPTLNQGERRFGSLNVGFVPRSGFAPLDLSHLGDKTVSPSRNSFDIFLPGSRFAEGLAQSRDVGRKVALFHNSVWPNAMDQLVLVEEVPVRFDEHTKGVEDLCAQGDRLSFPRQPALFRVEPEGTKLVDKARFPKHPHVPSLRKSSEGFQTR